MVSVLLDQTGFPPEMEVKMSPKLKPSAACDDNTIYGAERR